MARHLISLLRDDKALFEFMQSQIPVIYAYNRKYAAVLRMVLELQGLFSTKELKKSLLNLYEVGLDCSLGEHEHIKTLVHLMSRMPLDVILGYLGSCVAEMEGNGSQSDFEMDLQGIWDLMKIVDEKVQKEREDERDTENDGDQSEDHEDEDSQEEIVQQEVKRVLGQVSSKRQTRVSKRTCLTLVPNDPTSLSGLHSKLRVYFTEFFKFFGLTRSHLKRYSSFVFHELVYFTDPGRIMSKVFIAK